MKKILFVVPSLSQANGIPSFLINYIDNFDLNNFNIDILSSNYRTSDKHLEFFKRKNINVFLIDDLHQEGFKKYYKSLKKFFKEHNDYDLIYSNVVNQSLFIFHVAKIYRIKNYALHSHASSSSSHFVKKIINDFLTKLVLSKTNNYFACSYIAGKDVYKNKNFTIINNAVDYDRYRFNIEKRIQIRDKYNIDGILVGFVGRFAAQKNIYFFIDLAKKIDNSSKIMMIGTGVLKEEFVNKAREENVFDKFIFIDECSDVYNYYSAFDIFVLPSHYEGLPVVSVEAQANGLDCLLSDTISDEANILDSTLYLDRNDVSKWLSEIKLRCPRDCDKVIKLSDKFDIRVQSKKFEKILLNLCESGDKNDI